MMLKAELRKEIRRRKGQYSTAELKALSAPIISRLMAHPRVRKASTILMYYSLADEVCTHQAINQLLAEGKKVLLPKVTDGKHMELRLYTSPDDLALGAYNIMEPTGETFTCYNEIDTAVIPGMAFDASGNRMGRGKGYYDRFLALLPKAYKIGICFSFQFVNNIPTSPLDIPVDEVLHD